LQQESLLTKFALNSIQFYMSNYKFKTTNIRGKQYVEVNERIKFFRQENKYDGWGIHTDINMLDGSECLCKCTITNCDGEVIAQGHAHEVQGSSNINKTSYIENCETSAVGRALAMLGIGIDTSIASANEVNEAIAKQQEMVDNPHVQKLSKALDAPVENIMDKAVSYIKGSSDKQKAFDSVMKKYETQLTDKQITGLKKFVR